MRQIWWFLPFFFVSLSACSSLQTVSATKLPHTPAVSSVTPAVSSLQTAFYLAEQVSIGNLMADVIWLSDDARRGRKAGTPDEDAVGQWLAERFQKLGLRCWTDSGMDSYYLPFNIGRKQAKGQNVIAILPGNVHADHYVLIGAHYDHLGVAADGQVYNGADDDATGVAAVLEAARIFSAAQLLPQKTIVFVAFSAEEMGWVGSAALGDQLHKKGLNERSVFVNLEVLGAEKGMGSFLNLWDQANAGAQTLIVAAQTTAEQIGIATQHNNRRDPGSDAVAMSAKGVPSITIDVAWKKDRSTHPHVHRSSDDPEHIDQNGFLKATKVAVASVWLLANDGQ
jgi:hypothetical protein